MVIPVCYKCQNPVKIVSSPEGGLEIISYHCTYCQQTSASFLLGYVELGAEIALKNEPESETDQRARFFSAAPKRYQLRARIQGLQEHRLSNESGEESEADIP